MEQKKSRIHYAPECLINPVHEISVDLVGAGGNGSIMLSCLASINHALIQLERKGLQVTVYDNDEVSEANLGRQMFAPADLYCNKADALVTRFNRIFGTEWTAVPTKYKYNPATNIIISCTDNVASRKYIAREFNKTSKKVNHVGVNYEKANYYWLDLGNTQSKGQAILGSKTINQPAFVKYETIEKLPCVTDIFKLSAEDDKKSGPSCSLAEALKKQDLFINRAIATEAADILWKLLRYGHIEVNGFFKNLEEMRTVPLEI